MHRHKPPHVIEIFLQPGEYYFGDKNTRIRTVLGSCVSISFWHAELLVGGLCHYMLPSRSNERRNATAPSSDGRYADEAIAMLLKEIDATGVPYREFQVKLFGGGNMFPDHKNAQSHVGIKNVETARKLVQKHGFNCVGEHLGGDGHRNIIFNIWSGDVWVRHASIISQDAANEPGERRTEWLASK